MNGAIAGPLGEHDEAAEHQHQREAAAAAKTSSLPHEIPKFYNE
jgi:hypothetical protein